MSRWFEEVYGSTITVSIVGNLVVLLRFRDFACVFFTFGAALHQVMGNCQGQLHYNAVSLH